DCVGQPEAGLSGRVAFQAASRSTGRSASVVEDRSCCTGISSSHLWDGQIPCANTGSRRLSVALSTEASHSVPVVNFVASVWPMAHVMQKTLNSITCTRLNQLLISA